MDRARTVVGRDRDHARTAIARFVQEVRVGDARRRRIEGPEHQVVRAEPIVGAAAGQSGAERDRAADREVADVRRRVGDGRAEQMEEAQRAGEGRAEVHVAAEFAHDALAPAACERVDQRAGDLVQCLVPADPFPAARPARPHALQRIPEPGLADGERAAARALLAAARIPVRHRGVRRCVRRRLLFAPHDAVADVEIPGAGRHAVGARVRAAHDAVPAPLRAVDVLPVLIERGGGRLLRGLGRRERAALLGGRGRCGTQTPQQQQRRSGGAAVEEAAARDAPIRRHLDPHTAPESARAV